MLTDKPERFFVNETIREKILQFYKKEIPYAVEIETEEFFEDDAIIRMRAVIMVERDSQKGILIGKGGSALKRVGSSARRDIEALIGREVFLQPHVKVREGWRNHDFMLNSFGYGKGGEG